MKTSPRNIRLTEESLEALKILKNDQPSTSTAAIISQSLIDAAARANSATVIHSNLLDPNEYMAIQAAISELSGQHRQLKKDLFKIKPQDKESAEKIGSVLTKAQAEIDALTELRRRLAKLAQATAALTPKDAIMITQQVVHSCRLTIADPNAMDFLVRKSQATLRLIEAVFPDLDD